MFAFGAFELDATRYELRRNGARVHLEPQVFDLLLYLVEHRDRVVTKDEILVAIWGGKFVGEAALTTRLNAARRAVDDDGSSQQVIRTIRQRGYQFVAPLVADELPAVRPPAVEASLGQDVRFCRSSDGVQIAYSATGSGPVLVKAANWMTHIGYDLDSPVWRHWLIALSTGRRLLRYDERGCGMSDWDIPTFAFDDWVRDLETVVDAAGLDTFPLLGISQGGAVAIDYAVRHPGRVSKLILVGAYAQGRATRAMTEDDRRAAALDLELARLGWGRDDPAFRQVFAMQFLPDGTREEWDAFDELQRRTTSPANAVRFIETFGSIDVREQAVKVQCPTLILHGREDHRVPFQCARELAELIPDSQLVPLPSRNHLMTGNELAWPVFLDEVARFLL